MDYGWTKNDILALTTEDRKWFVKTLLRRRKEFERKSKQKF